MAKDNGDPLITREFIKNLARGSVKSIPLGGALLEQVIYGTLDEQAAKAESKKLHQTLAKINDQLGTAETDFAEILLNLNIQADFNEKVSTQFDQIFALLKDPDHAPIPENLPSAVDSIRDDTQNIREDTAEIKAMLKQLLEKQPLPKTPTAKGDGNRPSVFISYSHKDESLKDLLRSQLGILEKTGRITVWDDRNIDGGEDWYDEIKNAMKNAAVTVCLISPDYLASDFIYEEEIPALINRRKDEGMILLPVLVRPCLWEVADWLSSIQMIPRDGKSISPDFDGNEDTPLRDVARCIFEIVGNPDYLPPAPPQPVKPALPDRYISIERLPQTGIELFGRSKELAMLDEFWESESTNITSFVAYGGVGKSTLINKWLAKMKDDNFRGAQRVYGWSFYSQGTGQRITSADTFINESLQWFGDPQTARSNLSAWEKGRRLAELIREQRTLLILDGLEPLQSGFDHEKGVVKDPALAVLLDELARANPGLCVITTREELTGLNAPDGSLKQENLELISAQAGRSLLRFAGIRGNNAQLEQAAEDFGNHALAVRLLSAFLQDVPGRHINHASTIPDLDIPAEEGKHSRRVMEAFIQRFGPSPELNILNIMGLFDRPATAGEIKWLRTRPEIEALTDQIHMLTDDQWDRAVSNLRHANLITPQSHHDDFQTAGHIFIQDNNPHRVLLDAHPHVRTHFGERLKAANLDTWKQGHIQLYEYLPKTVPHQPDNIEEMTPLFRAVYHGCAAGLHQQVYDDVYLPRIRRGNEHYSIKHLGAYGLDLAAVTCFFKFPWYEPSPNLTDSTKALILNETAVDLSALGRLADAAQLFRAGLDIRIKQQAWQNASRIAENLCESYLTLGSISDAIDYGQKSIDFADKSDEVYLQIAARTDFASALAQAGRIGDAQKLFAKAVQMQKDNRPDLPLLFSFAGYKYCDFLLDSSEYDQIINHATQTLGWAKEYGAPLLDIAFDNLLLGRGHLQKILTEKTGDFTKAADYLKAAVNSLRKAGRVDHMPSGLLARAQLYRVTNEPTLARHDLDEAYAMSTRMGARLHQADCCLEYTRLYLAQSDTVNALKYFAEAEAIITETGYHRRDKDLADLRPKLT